MCKKKQQLFCPLEKINRKCETILSITPKKEIDITGILVLTIWLIHKSIQFISIRH
jgi:hypothetical protein